MSKRTKTIRRFRYVWAVITSGLTEDPAAALFVSKKDAEDCFFKLISAWSKEYRNCMTDKDYIEITHLLVIRDPAPLQKRWHDFQEHRLDRERDARIVKSKLVTDIIPASGYDVVCTAEKHKRQVVLHSFSTRARAESFIDFRRELGDDRDLSVE